MSDGINREGVDKLAEEPNYTDDDQRVEYIEDLE